MRFENVQFLRVQQVCHQGRLVTVAEAKQQDEPARLWYHILDLTPPTAAESEEQLAAKDAPTGPDLPPPDAFRPLDYPDQVRLVGMELVTVDASDSGVSETTIGNWTIVSDEELVYVFRSLSQLGPGGAAGPAPGHVYANRYAIVDVPVDTDGGSTGDGSTTPVLRRKIESRYRRSRLRDTPVDPDDSAGFRDMDGQVFYEPTMLFGMLAPADDRFTVVLTPSNVADGSRWQFFCADEKGTVASYSYRRDANGWPDLTGERGRLDTTGSFNLAPDAVTTLTESSTGGPLTLAGQPTALLYRRQEQGLPPRDPEQDAPGEVGSAITGPRIMLASLVDTAQREAPSRLMVIEFLTDETGRPKIPDVVEVASVTETRDSFDVRRLSDLASNELGSDLGLLEFADIAGLTLTDPMLLDAADGRIHLYTSGTTAADPAVPELLGFQYDTTSSRAQLEGQWISTQPAGDAQTGSLLVAAQQVGESGNGLSVEVTDDGSSPLPFGTIAIAGNEGAGETWPGMPLSLTHLISVLNGDASDDALDPLVADGTIPFYDYLGRRPTIYLPDVNRTLVITSALVADGRSPLPLTQAEVLSATGAATDAVTLILDFEAANANGVTREWTIALEFEDVPRTVADIGAVLSGTEPGYRYTGTDAQVRFGGQVQRIPSGRGSIDIVSVADEALRVRIDDEENESQRCQVRIEWNEATSQFRNVPRDPASFIRVLNWVDPDYDYDTNTTAATKQAAVNFVVLGTNMERQVANLDWLEPEIGVLPSLSALYAVLTDAIGSGEKDGLVPTTYPVGPAQGPTGVSGDPRAGSSLVRSIAVDLPTSGFPAIVQPGKFTDRQRGGFGGWLGEHPVAATFPEGTVGSAAWDPSKSPALACRNDLTLEAWVRPAASGSATERPRIVTVNGNEALSGFSLGLAAPAPNAMQLGGRNNMMVAPPGGLSTTTGTALWQFNPSDVRTGIKARVFELVLPDSVLPDSMAFTVGVTVDQPGMIALGAWVVKGGNTAWVPFGEYAQRAGEWRQHALSWGEDGFAYYVGDQLIGVARYATVAFATCWFGTPFLAPPGEPGTIASPRLYSEALPQARIAEIASYGATLDDNGLLGAWEFDRVDAGECPNLCTARPEWTGKISSPGNDWGPVPGPQATAGASRPFAAIGNRVVYGGLPLLPAEQWSHVAAVSTGSHALRFDGTQNAVIAEADGLDPGTGFSLDTMITWNGPDPDNPNSPQAIFAKSTALPRRQGTAPSSYQLGVLPDAHVYLDVHFNVRKDGKITKRSSQRFVGPTLTTNSSYALAVTCGVATTSPGGSTALTSSISAQWYWYTADGVEASSDVATTPDEAGQIELVESNGVAGSIASPTALTDSSKYGYFRGTIGQLRFWSRALDAAEAAAVVTHVAVPQYMDPPASEWSCNEGRGTILRDSSGGADARLSSDQVWISSRLTAQIELFVDGEPTAVPTPTVVGHLPGGYGAAARIAVGGMEAGQSIVNSARSEVAEVRIWDLARTQAQIDGWRWSRFLDVQTGLVGYWQLAAGKGTTFEDSSGFGNDLTASGYGETATWVASTAPLAADGPQVRNPLGGARTRWLVHDKATPAAAEYGALALDAAGETTGTMQRMYAYVDGGALEIVTGFAVGDLDLSYVGQAQGPPTMIGYVEGPPPVPGENLTGQNPSGNRGCTSVDFVEADTVDYVYTTQMDAGPDVSAKLGIGSLLGSKSDVGLGYITKLADARGKVGFTMSVDTVFGFVKSSQVGAGTTQKRNNRLDLVGAVESDGEGGERYVPRNVGYALVRSTTVNVFALRLRGAGTLVGMSTLPDPDIPEDWNLVVFPIEPTYTKLGTLDGRIGLRNDPDFPTANRERGSYFRPREAYDLVAQIEADAADLAARYASFDPSAGYGGSLAQDVGYDWTNDRPNRDLVNTYVWTADGGLFTEAEQTTAQRQDSVAGNMSVKAVLGVVWDVKLLIGGFGAFLDGNVLAGAHVKATRTKRETEQHSFGISVKVAPEGDLRSWDETKKRWSNAPTPGKVDAYRFKTFYLAPKPSHFETFFNEVVDQNWYNNSQDPAAVALRQARSTEGGVWRVLHRTTYVSRIPPKIDSAPVEDASEEAVTVIHTDANWWALALVGLALRSTSGQTLTERVAAAVASVLGTDLSAAIPWWKDFLAAATSDPTSREAEEYATLSQAMFTYVLAYYQSYPSRVPAVE